MLIAGKAFLAFAVKVIGQGEAGLLASLDKNIEEHIIFALRFLHGKRTACAVILRITIASKVFRATEIRQNALIRPARIAQLVPMVVIP